MPATVCERKNIKIKMKTNSLFQFDLHRSDSVNAVIVLFYLESYMFQLRNGGTQVK